MFTAGSDFPVLSRQVLTSRENVRASSWFGMEEYSLKCILNPDEDQLHISVTNQMFVNEVYQKNMTFLQLPTSLQQLFKNLKHFYREIQGGQLSIYFHDVVPSVRIGIKVGEEYKEYPIELEPQRSKDIFQEKRNYLEYAAEKAAEEYGNDQKTKKRELEELKERAQDLEEQQALSQRALTLRLKENDTLSLQIAELRRQSEDRMRQVLKLNPKQSHTPAPSHVNNPSYVRGRLQRSQKEYSRGSQVAASVHSTLGNHSSHQAMDSVSFKPPTQDDVEVIESKRNFWIQEVLKQPKHRMRKMVQFINNKTNFDNETLLVSNSIGLKTMLFTQIFPNLQILDLSDNKISKIEGITSLRWLRRLDISLNRIQVMEGMENLHCLKNLVLHNNTIKQIEDIFHMVYLNTLDLSNNLIERVPKELAEITRLEQVLLNNNCINHIDATVLSLRNLKVFSVVNNCLSMKGGKTKEVVDRLLNSAVKTAVIKRA